MSSENGDKNVPENGEKRFSLEEEAAKEGAVPWQILCTDGEFRTVWAINDLIACAITQQEFDTDPLIIQLQPGYKIPVKKFRGG